MYRNKLNTKNTTIGCGTYAMVYAMATALGVLLSTGFVWLAVWVLRWLDVLPTG
jgi:hypothetical protein